MKTIPARSGYTVRRGWFIGGGSVFLCWRGSRWNRPVNTLLLCEDRLLFWPNLHTHKQRTTASIFHSLLQLLPTSRVKYTRIVCSWVTYWLMYLLYGVCADKCVRVLNENTVSLIWIPRKNGKVHLHSLYILTSSPSLYPCLYLGVFRVMYYSCSCCSMHYVCYVHYEHVQYVWNGQVTYYCNLLKCNQSTRNTVFYNAMCSAWFSTVNIPDLLK